MMPTTLPLSDAEVRHEAATRFDTNLVVEAGAGTGKTSLLVERLLNGVGAGLVPLSSLGAITFTEKAAGEMRQRAAAGLERLLVLAAEGATLERDEAQAADRAYRYLTAEAGIDRETLRRRALEALAELPRARIDTVHGFCRAVLAEFPREAGVDPSFEVDAGEHFARVLDDRWAAFAERELGADAPRAELWRRLLLRVPLWLVELAARRLAGFDIPPQLLDPSRPLPTAERIFEPAVVGLLERTLPVLEALSPGSVAAASLARVADDLRLFREEGLGTLKRRIDADPAWLDRLQKRSSLSVSRKLPPDVQRETKALWRDAASLAVALYRNDDALIADLLHAAAPFALEAREALLRGGHVGFDGLLSLTRDLLRDHPAIRSRLRRRYRALFVDEFQDTDPLQYEIVLYLGERDPGGARDAYEAELEAGKLFVVGDAKQSIYRFRGADFAAYTRALDRIVAQGGRRLDLTANFRSVPEVLEPVNALFERSADWEPGEFQPPYVGIQAARPRAGEERVELWSLDVAGRQRVAERRRDEGWLIAQEIRRLREEQPDRFSYARVTILLRAFTNLGHYLRPLRELGIPFVVDGGREFMKRPEVTHLLAVLRAVAQPADPLWLLGYFRSPTGAVPDTELAAHAAAGGRWSLAAEVDPRELPALYRALGLLRRLVRETRDLPADGVVRYVIERTRLATISAAAYEGPQRVANLAKLGAVAAASARDGRLSLTDVLDALERERPGELESDSPLADERMDAVRVLTVHKAKGLENDIVFLPDLARQEGRPPWAPVHVDVARPPGMEPGPAMQVEPFRNALRTWFEETQQRHGAAEELRVLYVALTRARERLVLLAGDPGGRAPWIEALAAWGYQAAAPPEDGDLLAGGAVLHRRVRAERGRRDAAAAATMGAPQAVARYYRALEALQDAAVPAVRSPSAAETAPRSGPRPSRRRSRETARRVGTAVHAALERWQPGADPDRLASEAVARFESDETLGREVAMLLRGFAGSGLAPRLEQADVLARELPMLLRDESGTCWSGTIDLLYRDGDRVVVADFKTDRATEGADDDLRSTYAPQLRRYAQAVQRALELETPPRPELWLIREGRVLEL